MRFLVKKALRKRKEKKKKEKREKRNRLPCTHIK